jgi:signal transduction histidine kinase/DNA-binding response OmpR family regulator
MPQKVDILIIDDLPAQQLTIEAALADLGERLVTVSSGREGLKYLLDHDVAVILLDVNMPEMDGFETAALIRRRPRNSTTPIIFMTADNDELQAARGYALGAVDYIFRPFVPEVLRTKVQVFVELSRAQERVRREAEQRIALSREQARRASAEEHSRRARFLAEATGVLTRSLERPAFVEDLLALFLPSFADLVGIALTDPADGETTIRWRRANMKSNGVDAVDEVPADLDLCLRRVLARSIAEILPTSSRSGPRGIVLPLEVYGQQLGALAVVMDESGRRFAEADLDIVRDVASRTAIALDNRRLYRALSDRDRRKDEFLAMLSHELRNPLGAITTAAHVLSFFKTDDERVTHARAVVERQAQHLSRMVDDLLEVSRVTAGRITLTRGPVDLRAALDGVLDALRIAGRLDARTLVIEGQGVVVDGDAERLDQVLTNLLINAAKYTEAGGTITVRIEGDQEYGIVTVIDDGIGMSPDLVARVFDLFVQGSRTPDRTGGGLGIGLTLVQKLVEMQGGSVEAHSDGVGRGSRFVIRLPRTLPIAPVERAIDTIPAAKAATTAALRVLVVDDNVDFREMLRALLEWKGHEVLEAANGAAAIEIADRHAPRLALIDLGLPGMDGLEVARRLRQTAGMRESVLVAVTGYGQPEDLRRTLDGGFDAHLVKPVAPERLEDVVRMVAEGTSFGGHGVTNGAADAIDDTDGGAPTVDDLRRATRTAAADPVP